MKPMPGSSEEVREETPWTRKDFLLVVTAIFIKLGDGVEMYLPGVITQKVSCELGVTSLQENVLAVILYLFWAMAVISSLPIIKKFGETTCLFLSLYLSIIFAILCALVPNYYTLLLSRALTGICGGLNGTTIGIYLAKQVSRKSVLTVGSFLSSGLAYPVGGAWVSVLGWLILDRCSWRVFVLLTSIPLFLPPIVMLHLFLPDQQQGYTEIKAAEVSSTSDLKDGNKLSSVPNFATRVVKSSLFFSCSICIGFGSIILLPWLIRNHKSAMVDVHKVEDPCASAVQGTDFLILALITGLANVVGRPIGYFLWSRVPFCLLQSTLTGVMVLCYTLILCLPSLTAAEILLGVSKLCYSIQAVEIAILSCDYDYFGQSGLEVGSSITCAVGIIGGVVGTSLAAFLEPTLAVSITLGIACLQFVVVCFMKERQTGSMTDRPILHE